MLEKVDALDKAKIVAGFEKHISEPNISVDEYVRTRKIEVGRSAAQHKLIYLDTRYWIILRDVLLERRTETSSVYLLDCLRFLVRNHKVICPISESTFIELLKQEDRRTRRKTAELIDELSFGVTFAPEQERIGTEFAHFFHSHDERNPLYPLKWLIWSKLGFVLGVVIPQDTGLSPDIELAMQKVCFDQIWESSLTETVDSISDSQPPVSNFDELASKLNKGSAKNADKIINFKQLYLREIRGGLSLYMSVAGKILEGIFERHKGITPGISADERKQYERQLLNFFVKAFKKTKISRLLPTLHIHAICHASVRWDKMRKLKGNDLFDFHHAAAAVPYCDVFLTEKPLQQLLEQKHLEINQDFDCKIISSVSEAVGFLEKD